jgi:class 3 adenylate cyclase
MKKTHTIFIFILLFVNSITFSQEGNFYLNHYQINETNIDSKVKNIEFNNNNAIFIAGRKGVSLFNGTSYKTVQNIPSNVLTLKTDTASQIIYTGLKGEFGYILKDKTGVYKYIQLMQTENNFGEFNEIIITQKKVIFYSNNIIFIVNKKNFTDIKQLENPDKNQYSGIITRRNNIYINIKGKGIHKLKEEQLSIVKKGEKFKNSEILFSSTFNKANIIIGTNENKLYIFNGIDFKQFSDQTQVRDFLEENILWDGVDFSQKYFVLSTLTGGCVIIDKIYGKIKFNINYMTGLPDDEIHAIAIDKNNSLWIAHQFGLSSFNPSLNIRDYSFYPGIYGNINDVLLKEKNIYVASNNGVYMLKELKDIKEKEILVKKKAKYGYKFIPKMTYITQSLGYKFIPVTNLSDKCKQLYQYKEKILSISDFGLYEITDSTAIPLVKDIYINSLCEDNDTSVLYAATLKGIQLLSYTVDSISNKVTWKKNKLFEDNTQATYSIIQDENGNLIFGTDGKAFFAKKDSSLFYSTPVEIKFPEKVNEAINVKLLNNEIVFIQSAGIFEYDSKTNSVNYKSKENYILRNFRFIENNTNAWIYENNSWISIDASKKHINNKYWNIFKQIRKLYIDKDENTWLINGKRGLIKILADSHIKDYYFKIKIAKLSDKLDSLYTLKNPIFAYNRNALKIELSAPFSINPEETQYRFKVIGLLNYENWSNWSKNPVIELSYIPAGDYTLIVSAKNTLGQLSNEQKISFTILKPFWQTKTFYYSVGGGTFVLLLLLFYLSRLRLKRKNRILEQKIRERTIELQEEKDKTEELILNILPKETAEELKLNNKVIPKNYDIVTVLFTDFKGFTMVAEKLTPEELVYEIDYCFREFDKIISKYKIEKIKTIGDAYMCAAGLPEKYKKNANEAVKAALDIRDFMHKYKEQRKKENKIGFEIRIGLHSGKVVAGVVGIKKYAYDIWGDAVNTAARMESSGEPGKVNVSGDTYKLIKKNFKCTHRGKIKAKNKGEIDMYFVETEK